MTRLTRVEVQGFRSLRDVALELAPDGPTVLIGPNGSGKSNLLDALRLVCALRDGRLRLHVGQSGGASRLLHQGTEPAHHLRLCLRWQDGFTYEAVLGPVEGDLLAFLDERVQDETLGQGHAESYLVDAPHPTQITGHSLLRRLYPLIDEARSRLQGIGAYHLRDTSATAPLRRHADPAEDRKLASDGAHFAAFLWRLKEGKGEDHQAAIRRIEGTFRRILPGFKALAPRFVDSAHPESSFLRLDWETQAGQRFRVADLSDGSLRALYIFTLLGQPTALIPAQIFIDEPELGLHPAALNLVVAMARSVAHHSQVVLTTHSMNLLDAFEVEQVRVAESDGEASRFRHLDRAALEVWLEDYSLGQLYDKNLLGGRP
jgi:predicted ATPase